MILEVLYFATAISVASQQESFEQQDERERQYEYDSQYYSKPEDTRSTLGRFMLLKLKGEIRDDGAMQNPPTTGRNNLIGDIDPPFPFLFPPLDSQRPFPFPPLHNLFSHPLMSMSSDHPLFSHPMLNADSPIFPIKPQEFLETAMNGDGRVVTVSQIFGSVSFRKPNFASGPTKLHNGQFPDQFLHTEEAWAHFPYPIDFMPSFEMPTPDVPSTSIQDDPAGRFFFHTPFMDGEPQHDFVNNNGFQNHDHQFQEADFDGESSAHQKEGELPNPFLFQYPLHDRPDPMPFPLGSNPTRKDKAKCLKL